MTEKEKLIQLAEERLKRIGIRGGWCFDCGRKYGDEHGFPDLGVPHDIWNNQISPTGNEGGLLCPSCICKRLYDKGIETKGTFRSGPLCEDN